MQMCVAWIFLIYIFINSRSAGLPLKSEVAGSEEELVSVFLPDHPFVRGDRVLVGLLEEIFMLVGRGF